MKPSNTTISDAQQAYQVRQMVDAADTIALAAGADTWRARRARRRLRRLASSATPEMIADAARMQRQAANAEALMITTDSASVPQAHGASMENLAEATSQSPPSPDTANA